MTFSEWITKGMESIANWRDNLGGKLADIFYIVQDWWEDTIEWIGDAFTNWDTELYDFWDQIVYMGRKTGWAIRLLMDKGSHLLKEIGVFIRELSQGFKGWQ